MGAPFNIVAAAAPWPLHNRKRNANARSIGGHASGYSASISPGVTVGQVNSG